MDLNNLYKLAFDSYKNKNYKQAIDYYNQLLAINQTIPEVHMDLGNAYFMCGDLKKAETHYLLSLNLSPNDGAYNNLGNVYNERCDYQSALNCYKKSIELNASNLMSYINIGLTSNKLRNIDESIKYYDYVLSVDPNNVLAKWNGSLSRLTKGQYIRGWDEFEYRFETQMDDELRLKKPWNGCFLDNKTIFVCAEQGFGDTLQFVRYIPMVKEFGGKIIFGCQPELIPLLKNIDGVDEIVSNTKVEYDYDIHLLSLPRIFRTTLHTIPRNFPYINIDVTPINIIQNQPGLKVGLVWAGNPRKDMPQCHNVDKRRSMKLEQLKPLSNLGISLFSLQMPNSEAFDQIKNVDFEIINVMNDVKDFNDTANIVMNLDLVIAVDTSIVHLVGALNKPIWVLSRFDSCWRWLENRTDSPWYPSMKIFRQPKQDDWESVVDEIVVELKKIINPYNIAIDLYNQERFQESIPYFEHAIALNPVSDYYINLGNVYNKLIQIDKALNCYIKALELNPDDYQIYNNIGLIFFNQSKYDEALNYFYKIIELYPDMYRTYNNIGITLYTQRKYEESIKYYCKMLEFDPSNDETKTNLSYALLMLGKYTIGWEFFESRNNIPNRTNWQDYEKLSNNTKPKWKGENLTGKTILIYIEQGLGDIIQFCRYIQLVKEYNCTIILQCYPELEDLLKNLNSLSGGDAILIGGIPLNLEFDYHISIMSLPYIFKTTLYTIPNNIPYFNIPKEYIPEITRYSGLKVGIVWAGNPRIGQPQCTIIDKRRSMNLKDFKPLSEIVTLFSIQMMDTDAARQLDEIDFNVVNLMNGVVSFYDTAKIIQNLDLVIAVDTSIVHLVGALGKPIWLLSRYDGCWRWLENRTDSPWYPTMKIFRQHVPGDWMTVIDEVKKELKDFKNE